MDLLKSWVTWFFAGLISYASAMHPHAAVGAAAGLCFFVVFPPATTRLQRLFLAVFSFFGGYATGVLMYGEGPPWSTKAMLPALIVSALIAVIATAAFHMVNKDGDLPPWLKSLIDRFLNIQKGSE